MWALVTMWAMDVNTDPSCSETMDLNMVHSSSQNLDITMAQKAPRTTQIGLDLVKFFVRINIYFQIQVVVAYAFNPSTQEGEAGESL